MTTIQMLHGWKKALCLMLCGMGLIWCTDVFAKDRRIARPQDSGAGEKRGALVIGNGAYDSSPLRNPPNDARTMAQALRGLSFEVIEKVDLDEKKMRKAIDDFGEKIRGGGVGLFYYSGHGVQVNGRNYMIPVHAAINGESDVEYESVEIGRVLGKMADARNRMNIVILDACRNNPYERSFRNATQGLAFMNAPAGTLIAYSTSPGSVAGDGSGNNGTYTAELINQMGREGLKLEEVFKQTRAGVHATTGGKQVPWEHSSIVGDFYFMVASGRVVVVTPEPVITSTSSLQIKSRPAGALVHLDGAKKGTTPITISDLTSEKIRVRVELEGYVSQEKKVELSAGSMTSAEFLLDPIKQEETGPRARDTWTDPVTGMVFVWVPGGCYQMGCGSWTNDCGKDEGPVHEVCVDGFWMGQTEVTQGQWQRVMGNNPSRFQKGNDYPVETVSWDAVKEYIRKLNGMGIGIFRLPSEAEWEYAARSGGKAEKYSGSNDVNSVAWYSNNSGSTTHAVKTKRGNGLDIFDMSGNVFEWCEDVYIADIYSRSDRKNPIYTSGGSRRVFRGGGWGGAPGYVRCADRDSGDPARRYDNVGFRLLRMP